MLAHHIEQWIAQFAAATTLVPAEMCSCSIAVYRPPGGVVSVMLCGAHWWPQQFVPGASHFTPPHGGACCHALPLHDILFGMVQTPSVTITPPKLAEV